MADVSNVVVNGVTYALNDANAETKIAGTVIQSTAVQFMTGSPVVSTAFNQFDYVDLYFVAQGYYLPVQRIFTSRADRTHTMLFGWLNTSDSKPRRLITNFTTSGRYLSAQSIVFSYNNDAFSALAESSTPIYLAKAIGYTV